VATGQLGVNTLALLVVVAVMIRDAEVELTHISKTRPVKLAAIFNFELCEVPITEVSIFI
jgi:hypothetical protein